MLECKVKLANSDGKGEKRTIVERMEVMERSRWEKG
jgi:hypothetical protein